MEKYIYKGNTLIRRLVKFADFGISLYLALIISRIIELKVLKHHRAKGRNTRSSSVRLERV